MTVIHGSVERPEAESTHPTQAAELDADLRDLHRLAPDWIATSLDERIHILDSIMRDTAAAAEDWVRAACAAKQIPFDAPQGAEDWYTGPGLTIRNARLIRDSLIQIRDHGVPRSPGPVTTTRTGQVKVQVFPTDNYDKIMFQGVTGEVWMEPGVTPGNLVSTQAGIYRPGAESPPPRVCLILGAGNVSSIPPNDAFTKLFQENQVVILKMNPVNEYVGDHLERSLAALINRGFLKIVYGKADVGKFLTAHQLVDTIHVTGSDKTYDAIVWGPHEVGEANKAAGTRINTKPITAELGNVSPVIVVPGPWTDKEIAFQGEHLAASLVNNAGFNCNATRVILTHADWKHREALLESIGEALLATPARHPYYPGAVDRWEMFVNGHPEARTFGESGPDRVPWTFITGIDPSHPNDLCFQTESFNGVMAEAPLTGDRDVVGFLREAVELCNDKIWGSLNVTIIIHPSQLEDSRIAAALEEAIAELRYGTIGVNMWAAFGFALMSTTWGAYPGHPAEDIQSGDGLVHNTYFYESAQKSVLRGPFTQPLRPIWFPTSRTSHTAFRQIVSVEADPSPVKLPSLIAAAVRS